MAASELSGFLLPYWLCFVLLGITLGLFAGLTFLALYYRNRLLLAVAQAPDEPVRFDPRAWHPDRSADLENLAAELKGKHQRLQQHYNVLLARHKTLISEFQRLQQGTPARRMQPNGSPMNA